MWRIGGALLLLAGLVTAGLLGAAAAQDRLKFAEGQSQAKAALDQAGAAEPVVGHSEGAPDGTPLARMRIPRLGTDMDYVVLQGTGPDVLSRGPGHYRATAGPGEVGNFAVAGHRNGRAGVFEQLDQLRPCDVIEVATETRYLTYEVLPYADSSTTNCGLAPGPVPGRQIVTPSRDDVLNPVPGQKETAEATAALITLTTCHPWNSSAQRLIVHGVLTESEVRPVGTF
ncbi:class E sortase [Pseudonocardia nantongensis]|uniref:class E sortase n=1 Tax=Pseudonocardia nantongensis TaxID=1181885 RepID=UPI00397AFB22